ncbi:MAG: hypothetical protein ACSLFB_01200 [Acidimicrobiales bacterium]
MSDSTSPAHTPAPASARAYSPTALPSPLARMLAFGAIIIGGACGMFVGWRFADLQCGGNERVVIVGRAISEPSSQSEDSDSGCKLIIGAGTITGSVIGAGGIAVVSVMTLRAMGEWRKDLEVDVQD